MLNIQYRMHPSIARFPSHEFYNRAIQDGTVDKAGNVPDRLLPPTSRHLTPLPKTGERPSVIFMDHRGPDRIGPLAQLRKTRGDYIHDARCYFSRVARGRGTVYGIFRRFAGLYLDISAAKLRRWGEVTGMGTDGYVIKSGGLGAVPSRESKIKM